MGSWSSKHKRFLAFQIFHMMKIGRYSKVPFCDNQIDKFSSKVGAFQCMCTLKIQMSLWMRKSSYATDLSRWIHAITEEYRMWMRNSSYTGNLFVIIFKVEWALHNSQSNIEELWRKVSWVPSKFKSSIFKIRSAIWLRVV